MIFPGGGLAVNRSDGAGAATVILPDGGDATTLPVGAAAATVITPDGGNALAAAVGAAAATVMTPDGGLTVVAVLVVPAYAWPKYGQPKALAPNISYATAPKLSGAQLADTLASSNGKSDQLPPLPPHQAPKHGTTLAGTASEVVVRIEVVQS